MLHEYSSSIKVKQALLGVLSASLLAATVGGSAWAVTAFVSVFTGVVKKVGLLPHVHLTPALIVFVADI